MTGRGRGRGRAAFFQNSDVEPRPGTGDSSKLQEPVQNDSPLRLPEITVDEENIVSIVTEVLDYGEADSEKHKEAVQILFSKCTSNWHLAKTLSHILHGLTDDQEYGMSYRSKMLMVLQKRFSEKEKLRKDDLKQYLSVIAILSQIFSRLRVSQNQVFKPLLDPLVEGLEMLVDKESGEEELQCAAVQIAEVGQLIYGEDSNKLDGVMRCIRDIVIDSRGSRETRESMIKILERNAAHWK